MSTDVVTRSYDFARTGANLAEMTLTPAALKSRGIKTLLTLNTPDDPRLEAQPLYLSGINIGGKTRSVIYQATMGNTIYAWDADTGQNLWQRNLGTPINGSKQIDSYQINVKWGILSTPVIDRAAGVLYACAWISPDKTGNWQTGQHFVAAVDLVTGQLRRDKPLLSLEGASFDPGFGLPTQKFVSFERKQRAALALVKGGLLVSFGTIQETAKSARGWVIAVDTASWVIAATWCSTGRASGGGIWMSGGGPAIQKDGSIWLVTGNGDFDGEVDFGESVVRLGYTPPSGTAKGSLKVTGWWTPWTDDGRTGGSDEGEGRSPAELGKLKSLPTASNFRRLLHIARAGMTVTNADWGDQDLGASGIVLVEALGIGLVSGKDGILYTIDLASPGGTAPGDLAPAKAPANYARLAAPPILYTYYAPVINPATPNPTTLNQWPLNVTHHLHGTPLYWQSAAHGHMHFCGGENGNLRAWTVNGDKSSAYLGCSSAYASPDSVASPNPNGPHGGMPGWSIALSASGNTNGVVWGMIPYGDANMELTTGRLLAYDAANLGRFADGSGEIAPLWDSQDWNWDFLHPKFNRPIAVEGKVIVPTYDGRVLVLGLA
jgi:PQQ-like domain